MLVLLKVLVLFDPMFMPNFPFSKFFMNNNNLPVNCSRGLLPPRALEKVAPLAGGAIGRKPHSRPSPYSNWDGNGGSLIWYSKDLPAT